MRGFLRGLDRPGKTVGEYFTRARSPAGGQRLKDHVIARLRIGSPIP